MEIKDRLRMIMESHKLNAGSFAGKIGVQRSNVSHVLSGRNKPSFDFVEKLLLAFPRVSAEWLLLVGNPRRKLMICLIRLRVVVVLSRI
jgi:transcriptional regulator with XRE-family HTH domain